MIIFKFVSIYTLYTQRTAVNMKGEMGEIPPSQSWTLWGNHPPP